MQINLIEQSVKIVNWADNLPEKDMVDCGEDKKSAHETVVKPSIIISTLGSKYFGNQREYFYSDCWSQCNFLMQRNFWTPFEFFDVTFAIVAPMTVFYSLACYRTSFIQEPWQCHDYLNGFDIIEPVALEKDWFAIKENAKKREIWKESVSHSVDAYSQLVLAGVEPEKARLVLPEALAANFYCKMNLLELRRFVLSQDSEKEWTYMKLLAFRMKEVFSEKFKGEGYLLEALKEKK